MVQLQIAFWCAVTRRRRAWHIYMCTLHVHEACRHEGITVAIGKRSPSIYFAEFQAIFS
jgi:hypothetical protein